MSGGEGGAEKLDATSYMLSKTTQGLPAIIRSKTQLCLQEL